jgi:hypothetical protein
MPTMIGPGGPSCTPPDPTWALVAQNGSQCTYRAPGPGPGNFSSNMGLRTNQNRYAQGVNNNQERYQATGRDPNGIPINTNGPVTFEWHTVHGMVGTQLVRMHNGVAQGVVPKSQWAAILGPEGMPGRPQQTGLDQKTLDAMQAVQSRKFGLPNMIAPNMGVRPLILGPPVKNFDGTGFNSRYAR